MNRYTSQATSHSRVRGHTVTANAYLFFKRRSGSEVATPVVVEIVSQGENVVRSYFPREVLLQCFLVLGFHIDGRRRVHQIDGAILVHVVNQFVQVVVPVISILVVEVTSARPPSRCQQYQSNIPASLSATLEYPTHPPKELHLLPSKIIQ